MLAWLDFIEHSHIFTIIQAILLMVVGYCIARLLANSMRPLLDKRVSAHQAMLIGRFAFYSIFALFFASAIQHLGFQIGTLLGAAGILTAAIGFASQTSVSNIISGVFIIGEKPFEIGDTVRINDVQGEVASIDLLSVKIRTGDNTMVRVPNETLIKTAITNFSYFSTRRFDLKIDIVHTDNFADIKNILLTVAHHNPVCLRDPPATVKIQTFTDAGVELQFSVWANRNDYGELKDTIQEGVQLALNNHGVHLSFPSRTLYMKKTVE